MAVIAKQLSDADIENLAAYWSQQPPGSDVEVPPAVAAIRTSKISIPKDFPKGFVVFDSKLDEKAGTVSRNYANAIALAAARAQKPLPEGSVIIVVNYLAKLDAEKQPVREADGSYGVGAVKSYSAMEARAAWGKEIPELLRNDSWVYGVFTPEKVARTEVNQAVCFACHKAQGGRQLRLHAGRAARQGRGAQRAGRPTAGALQAGAAADRVADQLAVQLAVAREVAARLARPPRCAASHARLSATMRRGAPARRAPQLRRVSCRPASVYAAAAPFFPPPAPDRRAGSPRRIAAPDRRAGSPRRIAAPRSSTGWLLVCGASASQKLSCAEPLPLGSARKKGYQLEAVIEQGGLYLVETHAKVGPELKKISGKYSFELLP